MFITYMIYYVIVLILPLALQKEPKEACRRKIACQAMSLDALSKEAQSWKIDNTLVLALLFFWYSGTAELELCERNQEMSLSEDFSNVLHIQMPCSAIW